MSSYRGAHGAWDGGPPGAEAEYTERAPVPPYAAPPAAVAPAPRAMPTTDPWTGVSYSHYGAMPGYDYRAYSATGYPYGYDSSSGYYQRPDGVYYGKFSEATPYQQHPRAVYDCPSRIREHRERTLSPVESRRDERRRSYRTNSRSVSPYERWQRTSKRDSSYKEETWRVRSRSKSLERKKYSSSDHSRSRSRSYSRRSPKRDKTKRRYLSDSSPSDASYDKIKKNRDRSSRSREKTFSGSRSASCRTHSVSRSISKSRKGDDGKKKKNKSHSNKDKKQRVISTPPRKRKESSTPPKGHKKSDRLSITPPKSYKKCDRSLTPPRTYKNKDRRSDTPLKKSKEQSLTPPKRYARNSTSKSRSRSPSLRRKHKHSNSSGHSSSNSTSRSRSSSVRRSSRSKSKRTTKRKSQQRSLSKSRSKRHSRTKSRSSSRQPSKSCGKRKRSVSSKGSKSRSRSRSSRRSRSQTGSGSDDERRGQFTVADRKRFWKLHRNKQEKEKDDGKDAKEVKPPPGAVESTRVDDVHYGDPPEVEGPNFAELLPTADQVLQQASTSKSKSMAIPIKNDGSFLEMFKKMQEETKKTEITEKKPEIKKPVLPFIGKRRGGRVLKTGLVKKAKAIDEQLADNTPKDAWSLYMQEVKKYRETSCEEERKTRPLVK